MRSAIEHTAASAGLPDGPDGADERPDELPEGEEDVHVHQRLHEATGDLWQKTGHLFAGHNCEWLWSLI